jgi:rod shape-determining protein MreB
MISGLPRKTAIGSDEVREALKEPIGLIVECVVRTLEKAEPELAADLVEEGIYLAGGGSLLRGLDTVISQSTGVSVQVCDEPLECVARGTSIFLEHLNEWKDTMESDEDEV